METGKTSILTSAFSGLEQTTLDELRHFTVARTYPPQTFLCRQGEIEHTFYVIVNGRIAVVRQLEDGQEELLDMLGPRQYFGEMGLLDHQPRMASCMTLTETTVLELTEEVFDRLVEQSPVIAYAITRRMLHNMRQMDAQSIEKLQAKNRELQQAYDDLRSAQAELVRKERLEHELEIAGQVQRSLLPAEMPAYPDFRFGAYLGPARMVGGDFYDVLPLDDEHVGILLGDVADKSFHAALFMAVCRTLFQVECRRSLSPAQVAQAVHQGIMAVSPAGEVFVTVFYGVLHRPSGRLRYVNAGHEHPLLVRSGQAVEALPSRGRFLGMIDPLILPEFELDLRAGDRLVIFSDGVPDAINEADALYGHSRLADLLSRHDHLDPAELAGTIASDVVDWSGSAEQHDDVTIVVVSAVESG